MTQVPNHKPYDLEERIYQFAQDCRHYVKKLPRTITNIEYGKQLARSSGSQAANYVEANEATSKKDFLLRIKISKKETKESRLWLRLAEPVEEQKQAQELLIGERNELMRIFGSIVENSK